MKTTVNDSICLIKIMLAVTMILITSLATSQNLQLHYEGSNSKIKAAVAEANKILSNPEFYKKVNACLRFDHTTYNGTAISGEMQSVSQIEVDDYWNPFTKANAGTVSVINMNTAKLKRSKASIVNTLIHEAVHATDWNTNNVWDYTHDGNSPAGQGGTAPWVIGAIGEDFVK